MPPTRIAGSVVWSTTLLLQIAFLRLPPSSGVVVLAAAEYERLRDLEKMKAPAFADLLLAIPRDDKDGEAFEGLRLAR